jgi:hypothetical protein
MGKRSTKVMILTYLEGITKRIIASKKEEP